MPQLFLDCDGVLAGFNSLAESTFGESPDEAEKRLAAAGQSEGDAGHLLALRSGRDF